MTEHKLIPTDPFDLALSQLTGLPNGAHTQPTLVQAIDFYGNASAYMLQTIKWEEGTSIFITQVNSENTPKRIMLPPKVVNVLLRQQDAVARIVRRRHGQRLAEQLRAEGRATPGFTPEMRAKAAVTRKANAAKRAAKRARRNR